MLDRLTDMVETMIEDGELVVNDEILIEED